MENYRISVDVGGTFTDLIALSEADGKLFNIKIPTTPKEPAVGVIAVLREFLATHQSAEASMIIHATTIATNAITGQIRLELPKTALITTKGFRDIIEIGRQRRHELYNLFIQRPRPLVLGRHRYAVEERISSKGEVISPLSCNDIYNVARRINKNGIEAVAIGFLNSYINPEHEIKTKKLIQQLCSDVFITASHEVSPEHREYERFSTAVVNACLMTIVSTYITDLIKKIKELGVEAQLQVMQSSGGIASGDEVRRMPASIIESGPAAGVIAASFYGKLLGLENIMSFDMGGTTAKAGLVKGYAPDVVTEYEVGGRVHGGRIIKGSGYPVKFPFIDLSECSAGGGTIAWIDAGGALRVGPISAGADPGPACYGLGSKEPTITDANLILGRLNPNYILGGRMRIRRDLAERAIRVRICDKLRLNVVQVAAGIVEIVNSTMAKILRIISVERGYDPREFTLMAFGGAGPMHACALAEDLKIPRIVVPINPGLFSALGMLAADFRHHISRPVMKNIEEVKVNAIEEKFKEMEGAGREALAGESTITNVSFIRYADMRYRGQAYELMIPVPKPLDDDGLIKLVEGFHEKHRSVYGYAVEGEEVELINLRLITVGVTSKPEIQRSTSTEQNSGNALSTSREVFFERYGKYVKSPIYMREKVKPGNIMEGPCVIEQYDATTVVYPNWRAVMDEFGSLILTEEGENNA